ncbi:hypothetical protein HKCCE4037_17775 [Rhodobacterales bacterium HKCCE4037]|nr:hypothetical protein [Rhodobacterales bacterium HKCCE4037]
MPKHVRFLLIHASIGSLIAAAFVAMLLWGNVANLWHLVTHTSEGILAVFLLWAFCTITFGSAQMGIRIMLLAEDEDRGSGGTRSPQAVQEPRAIPIPVDRPRA